MSDNITLPREVVERVETLMKIANKWSDDVDILASTVVDLRDDLTELRTALAAPRLAVTVDPRLTPAEAAAISSALAAPRQKQEPVAYFDLQKQVFFWAKPTQIDVPMTVALKPLPLYAALAAEPTKQEPGLVEGLAELARQMKPLDADMAAILHDNLDSLYIEDEPALAAEQPKPSEVAELIENLMHHAYNDGVKQLKYRSSQTVEAEEALRTALAAPRPEPSGYAYRYADGVLRLNDGSQFNGGWPVEAVPYWFAPPALAAPEPEPEKRHPGYIIGSHWLETAYSRICAGEAEADVLRDCGWERVDDAEALRRDAESWRKSREKYTAWQKGTDLLETIHLQHAEIERLRDEVRVLRLYGNKDCTAMADEAMKKAALRREDKR